MPTARVVAVAPGSPAAAAGLLPGDELLTLNGEMVRDVIRYQIQADEPRVELEVRRGGLEQLVLVEKAAGAPLGLDLASAVFDRVRTCDNHCPFCFIYQLPPGMRKSLSLKDDDYRLSFLYGNFTTLTRFTEADLERVITEQLSPLYVSIHATDPELRARLLRNRRGATSLRWLAALLDAGHRGARAGRGLSRGSTTATSSTTRCSACSTGSRALATVGVVPLGVSDHTTEPEMRPHTQAEAERVHRRRDRVAGALPRRARSSPRVRVRRVLPPRGSPVPGARAPTTTSRSTRTASAWRRSSPTRCGPSSPATTWPPTAPAPASSPGSTVPRRRATAPPGSTSAVQFRVPRRRPCADHHPHRRVRRRGCWRRSPTTSPRRPERRCACVPVENRFFGGNIAVTGLLTGPDVARALDDAAADERFLLPDVVLSNGRFLDGTTPDDLPRPVEIVATDGASLGARRCGR